MAHYFEFVDKDATITRGQEADSTGSAKNMGADEILEVGKELAFVLSGGDTTLDKTLSEDDLFKLELDSFMKLIETSKTQERIKHTLITGKPLVN